MWLPGSQVKFGGKHLHLVSHLTRPIFNILLLCRCEYPYICMCAVGMPGAIKDQKRALDPLELELQSDASCLLCRMIWKPDRGPLQEQ